MPLLATWIREKDQPLFERFFSSHPHVTVQNARLEPVDLLALDGLLVTGGPDIDAQFHCEPVGDVSKILEPDPERDFWELSAVKSALERGLPILGICKGHQVLNLALGGTLHLDIAGHNLPEQKDGNIQRLRHGAGVEFCFEWVNSSHHQSLARLGQGLEVEAWAVGDDVIEQVRLRHYDFCVGVQYHPERDLSYAPLFDAFLSRLPAR